MPAEGSAEATTPSLLLTGPRDSERWSGRTSQSRDPVGEMERGPGWENSSSGSIPQERRRTAELGGSTQRSPAAGRAEGAAGSAGAEEG